MSTEQNKNLVRRFLEDVWGKGQTGQLSQFVARDICDHNPMPGQPRGLEGQRWAVEYLTRSFPDMRITIDALLAEGDRVVDHWIATGTHKGEFFGAAPTGKRFTMTGTDMCRILDGRITEVWHQEDNLSLMQQLGLAPMPAQATGTFGRSPNVGGSSSGMRGKSLSHDEKRAEIRRGYQEFVDRANPGAADTLLTPDFVGHFSAYPEVHGRDEFKKLISMYNHALSNQHAHVEDIVIDGDFAACRVTFTGKHTGEMMGMAPTGKQVNIQSLSVFRFAGDQVAEQWANNDDLAMLQQLGVIPVQAEMEMATPC